MASFKFSKFHIGRNLIAFIVLLFSAQAAYGQAGNDFPSPVGGIAPWSPGYPGGGGLPAPPGDRNWESGAVVGSFQTLWGVRKGDTIGFDVVLDGWGLGALYIAPMCSNCTNMRYLPPTDGSASQQEQWWHGSLGTWCMRCGWEATAGDDDPQIWLNYTAQRGLWFEAHMEWKYTIPKPPFSSWFRVLTDPNKQEAGAISAGLSQAGSVWNYAAIALTAYDWKITAIFSAMGYTADKLSGTYDGWSRDPFDWSYCSPVSWDYDWQAYNDLLWTWPYTEDSGTYLPYSGLVMISMGKAAQVAIDRALSAAQVADWGDSSAEQCAFERRAEALYYINQVGYWMWYFRWSVEVSADAYLANGGDPGIAYWWMYQFLDQLAYAASWSQGVQ